MDIMVLATQCWLNDTYGGDSRYNVIPEDGITGWTTINALIRALQIEFGIPSTADNFGSTTISKFNNYFPSGISINTESQMNDLPAGNSRKLTTEGLHNIFAIVQGSLWCKGYNSGHYAHIVGSKWHVDNSFDNSVKNAIIQLQTDAGRANPTGAVDLNIMMALLSMDAFVCVGGGSIFIRNIQQYLNKNYEAYIGLKPCDGVYGRGTNTAMIYAIQAEEGLPTSVANGNFGPTTKNCCPTIPYSNVEKSYNGTVYSTASISKFITLLQMSLFINGFGSWIFSGSYDSNTQQAIRDFQSHYALSVTGKVNLGTWLSLLTSCGDIDRSALACDCATILTEAKAQTLYNAGYRYVGRYLSGTIGGGVSKALSREELKIAFNAGLRIFPIQQSSANSVSYFTKSQAEEDALSALYYANKWGIPVGTTIYFAVDCDPQDHQITSNIIPYFARLVNTFSRLNSPYKIGIYGTRNACSRVSTHNDLKDYISYSFVGDMSTGFSGNLGFKIPDNWAFDQFATITVGSGTGQIEIDKDGFSGRDTGFGQIVDEPWEKLMDNLSKIYDLAISYTNNDIYRSNRLVLQYIRRNTYNGALWNQVAGSIDSQFVSLVNSTYGNMDFTFFEPFYETNGNKVKYDVEHLAATLNALIYEYGGGSQPGLDAFSNILAGWGGDALSFTSDIAQASENGEDDLLQWAKDNICRNDVNTRFKLEDYLVDVDAINMADDVALGAPFPLVFYFYFKPLSSTEVPSAKKRTSKWLGKVGTGYLEEMCDLIIQDELNIFAMLLAGDGVVSAHKEIAMEAFKSFAYKEYVHGK